MTRYQAVRVMAGAAIAMGFAVTSGLGQKSTKKKSYALRGKVEAVTESNRTLTVNHENVEGWMEAMTMAYEVDDPKVLKKVKAGDQIKATVYDGDYTLHDIQIVPRSGGPKPKK